MNTRTLRLAATLIAAAPLTMAHAQTTPPAAVAHSTQAVTLRYKFVLGQTHAYQLTIDTDGTMTGGPQGQSFPLKQHIEAVMRQTVKDVRASDGAATISASFDSFIMSMNGQTFPMPPAQMEQMRHGPTMVLSPDGKVLSVQANPAGASMPGMDMSKMGMFQGSAPLPTDPVKAGDTWTSTMSIGMANIQAASTYTLNSLDTSGGANNALIGVKFSGNFAPNVGKDSPALPMTTTGTLSGTGDEVFDVDAGALKSMTSLMDMDMSLTPRQTAQGGPAIGPMHMIMHMKMTMVGLKSAP